MHDGIVEGRSISAAQLVRLLGGRRVDKPAYRHLAEIVRDLILDGRLTLGVRMPAERALAEALQLSRTSISAAYRLLREEGFLSSKRGSGSYVVLPSHLSVRTSAPWAPARGDESELIDFTAAALPASDAWFMSSVTDALEELPGHAVTHGYEPMGVTSLRELIAQHYIDRGLVTRPEQILVTNGVQQALFLLLQQFSLPGDRVLVEEPTYPNALDTIRAVGLREVAVGTGQEGWDLNLIISTLHQTKPRICYMIPDFHNPTGKLMDERSRERLATAVRRYGGLLIVDETFAELNLTDAAMPRPVAAAAAGGHVVTIGSMSKPYWGGLRIGWIRAAPRLVRQLAQYRTRLDMGGPIVNQLIARHLLDRREDILYQRRNLLLRQRDFLAHALERHLPGWRFSIPPGGLSLWVDLGEQVSSALTQLAGRHGLRLVAGPRFGTHGVLDGFLRLPFVLPEGQLGHGVHRLATAFHDPLLRAPATPVD